MLYLYYMRRKNIPRVKRRTTEWINIERARKADIEAIGKELKLDKSDLENIMTSSHRSRFFESEDYSLLIFVHPIFDEAKNDVRRRELDVILTKNKIVTIHHNHFKKVAKRFKDASEGNSISLSSPSSVLARILHDLILEVYEMLETMSEKLDDLEVRALSNKEGVLEEILTVQTNLIDTKKVIENQGVILDRLLSSSSKSVRAKLEEPFEELQKHMKEVQGILSTEMETAHTLHQAHETYLNARTNKLIRRLTILSLVMLPATLMAGIFGMNTTYPWILGIRADFTVIMGIMAASALLILWRVRKW